MPMSRAEWLHDLRNAVNTALMSTSVVERLIKQGDTVRALIFLADARDACERSRVLLAEISRECDASPDGEGSDEQI